MCESYGVTAPLLLYKPIKLATHSLPSWDVGMTYLFIVGIEILAQAKGHARLPRLVL